MRWLALGLLVCACGEFSQARFETGEGEVTGRVVAPDGAPVEATVVRLGDDGRALARTRSGVDGRFGFDGVPAGSVRLAAFDALGRLATADGVVVARASRDVGEVVLADVDLSQTLLAELGFEQRLTSGGPVLQAVASRDGAWLAWRTAEGWFVSETSPWAPRALVIPEGDVVGIGLGFVWGVEKTGAFRVSLGDGRVERSFGLTSALGLSPLGLVLVDETARDAFLELWMVGSVRVWRPSVAQPEVLVDRRPDGLAFVALSPDGLRIAYAEQAFGGLVSGVLVDRPLEGAPSRSTGDELLAVAFDDVGARGALRKSASGGRSFQLESTRPLTLAAQKLVFDAGHRRWLGSVGASWFALPDGDSVTPIAPTWIRSGELTLFTHAPERFTQVHVVRDGVPRRVTELAADHHLLGASATQAWYRTRDPRTGVEQLFTVRLDGPR